MEMARILIKTSVLLIYDISGHLYDYGLRITKIIHCIFLLSLTVFQSKDGSIGRGYYLPSFLSEKMTREMVHALRFSPNGRGVITRG